MKALPPEPDHEIAAREVRTAARKYLHQDTSKFPRVPWPVLDKALGPLPPGTITCFAGLQGNGKTAFVLNLIDHWTEVRTAWIYFPLEIAAHIVLLWWAALRAGIPRYRLTDGSLTDDDKALIEDEVRWIKERDELANLVTGQRFTSAKLCARVKALVKATSARVVIVDHLQYMDFGNAFNRRLAVDDALKDMNELTEELGITFALTCQLSRTKGDRLAPWRIPLPSDLKESSGIEHVATSIVFLHRQAKPDTRKAQRAFAMGDGTPHAFAWPGRLCATVGKHRLGRSVPFTVPLQIWSPGDRITEVDSDVLPFGRPDDAAREPEAPTLFGEGAP